jgi:anti-anti-sigma factor
MLGVDIAEVGDVAGDLGRTTASCFAHAFTGWVGRPGLVIDLSDLLFLDGAGLPALVGSIRWARELAAEVVIACDARPLRNVLECVGLSPIVRVSDRTEDALAQVRSGAALRRLSPQTPPADGPPTGPSSVTFRVSREKSLHHDLEGVFHMGKIFHIGMAVPDLDKGLAEIAELFDLTWRPINVRTMTINDGIGQSLEIECHVTFSVGGPFAVEVWQAIPGTPLAMPESGYFHHIGYWVDDLAAESKRLDALGHPAIMSSAPSVLLKQGPGGLLLEPCDWHDDRPTVRDLFPPGSPHAGEPVFAMRH